MKKEILIFIDKVFTIFNNKNNEITVPTNGCHW